MHVLRSLSTALHRHREIPVQAPPTKSEVVWVFSGGGALGAAQAGMARALMQNGVFPTRVIGVSAGALNAAFIATDPSVENINRLCDMWQSLEDKHPYSSLNFHSIFNFILKKDHLIDTHVLDALIDQTWPNQNLEDLKIPVSVVSTCLDDECECVHSTGPVSRALKASSRLPGLMSPTYIDGKAHVDGGVLNNTPLDLALEQASTDTQVYVFDVASVLTQKPFKVSTSTAVLLAGFRISLGAQRRRLNVLLSDPRVKHFRIESWSGTNPLHDFSKATELINLGSLSVNQMFPKVLDILPPKLYA